MTLQDYVSESWVWVDIENTPQVLFLEPFIRALQAEGRDVRVTAKPQAQTLGLAEAKGIRLTVVGQGNLVGLARKVTFGLGRTRDLLRWVRGQPGRPCIQVQSSRTASLAALAIGLPAIALLDYEGAIHWPMAVGCRSIWFPDVLRNRRLPYLTRRVAHFYPGLKENLYLDGVPFDRSQGRAAAGAGNGDLLVVARPPADAAHYASTHSWRWWLRCMESLLERPEVRVLVVPRDEAQRLRVQAALAVDTRLRVLGSVVDGPKLVAAADLVVGGGGTMNREAAVLGTPAWSTFSGPRPWVDECLAHEGRLWWVHGQGDLEVALAALGKRPAPRGPYPGGFEKIMADLQQFLPT